MASEDVNFTSSSDSEDSEVNFIADYVLEVEGSPNSSDQDGEDLDKELEASLTSRWQMTIGWQYTKKKEKLMKKLRNNCKNE